MYNWEDLTEVVTGRKPTMFLRDIAENIEHIRKYKRALFIGGAGTIGLATIKEFMRHGCLEHIGIVDQDENAMAEAIRSVRNRSKSISLDVHVSDISEARFQVDLDDYDIVLWFAAMKHVRSERDARSCKRMLGINHSYVFGHQSPRFFYCSTDKAADPANLLGASKRIGEAMALKNGGNAARFANVAFSSGSLLQSWLYRMAEGQPLPVPKDIYRYLISPAEAGRICLLAATWKMHGVLLVPIMRELTLLTHACQRFIDHFGHHGGMDVTDPDTSGEKYAEKFSGKDEQVRTAGHEMNRVTPKDNVDTDMTYGYCASKEEIIAAVARAVPNFGHSETGKSLDGRA